MLPRNIPSHECFSGWFSRTIASPSSSLRLLALQLVRVGQVEERGGHAVAVGAKQATFDAERPLPHLQRLGVLPLPRQHGGHVAQHHRHVLVLLSVYPAIHVVRLPVLLHRLVVQALRVEVARHPPQRFGHERVLVAVQAPRDAQLLLDQLQGFLAPALRPVYRAEVCQSSRHVHVRLLPVHQAEDAQGLEQPLLRIPEPVLVAEHAAKLVRCLAGPLMVPPKLCPLLLELLFQVKGAPEAMLRPSLLLAHSVAVHIRLARAYQGRTARPALTADLGLLGLHPTSSSTSPRASTCDTHRQFTSTPEVPYF